MSKIPKSLNVSLTPELTDFIQLRVASGRYLSASEVVRAGLRLLERDEAAAEHRPRVRYSPETEMADQRGADRD